MLTPQEVDDLFATLRHMVSEGHGLVFISHKLNEVMAISDRVTVLRDGCMVGTIPGREATRDILVRMMVGREVKPLAPQPLQGRRRAPQDRGAARSWATAGPRRCAAWTSRCTRGEIVGLAGVSGNGQRELAQCLAGLRKVTAGTIIIDGKDLTHTDAARAHIEAGLAYMPEERMRDGAIREFSVEENVFLHDHAAPEYTARHLPGFSQDGGPCDRPGQADSPSRRPAWTRRSRICPAATSRS